jgi:predicted RNase H-like HicB family nuclease
LGRGGARAERHGPGWIAEALELPGVMTYGSTREEAIGNTAKLAIDVIADRITHGELPHSALSVLFQMWMIWTLSGSGMVSWVYASGISPRNAAVCPKLSPRGRAKQGQADDVMAAADPHDPNGV